MSWWSEIFISQAANFIVVLILPLYLTSSLILWNTKVFYIFYFGDLNGNYAKLLQLSINLRLRQSYYFVIIRYQLIRSERF